MGGQTDQQRASNELYNSVRNYNPISQNRFDNYATPYSGAAQIGALNKATNKGIASLKENTATNANDAGAAAGAAGSSRGYGGSILQDAIAKARAKSASGGRNAITQLMLENLNQQPGIMNAANQNQLAVTSGAQNADFQNIMDMFRKFGLQQGAASGLSNTNWLDDVLGVLNTGANVASKFVKP